MDQLNLHTYKSNLRKFLFNPTLWDEFLKGDSIELKHPVLSSAQPQGAVVVLVHGDKVDRVGAVGG